LPGGLHRAGARFGFVEPDRGTTILLAAVGGAMLLLAGVRWKYIIPPIVLAPSD
jgi:cell division protein FtsW (lipid II flippase)